MSIKSWIKKYKISENKNFIFDNETYIITYIYKYIMNLLDRCKYTLLLNFFHPKQNEKKKYNTSICAIFKNEAPYLKEWIEFHRIIGIDHFYLYNNFSNDDFNNILKTYIDKGIVTLINWEIPQGQMSAYKNCVETYSYETKWICFIDLDEFIVPNKVDNIYDFLIKFEKNRPYILCYWKNFTSSGYLKRNINQLVIEDFIISWQKYTNIGKLFFNTAYNYADELEENRYMHYRWAKFKNIKLPPINIFGKICTRNIHPISGNDFPIQINHYLIKSYDEYFSIKRKRGDAVYEKSNHDIEYFYEHDCKMCDTDYHAYKYLIKLKNKMIIKQ